MSGHCDCRQTATARDYRAMVAAPSGFEGFPTLNWVCFGWPPVGRVDSNHRRNIGGYAWLFRSLARRSAWQRDLERGPVRTPPVDRPASSPSARRSIGASTIHQPQYPGLGVGYPSHVSRTNRVAAVM